MSQSKRTAKANPASGAVTDLPLTRNATRNGFEIPGPHPIEGQANYHAVSPDYFRAMPAQEMSLMLHIATEPSSMIPQIEKEIWRVDPDQPVTDIKTMDEWVAREAARPPVVVMRSGPLSPEAVWRFVSMEVREIADKRMADHHFCQAVRVWLVPWRSLPHSAIEIGAVVANSA